MRCTSMELLLPPVRHSYTPPSLEDVFLMSNTEHSASHEYWAAEGDELLLICAIDRPSFCQWTRGRGRLPSMRQTTCEGRPNAAYWMGWVKRDISAGSVVIDGNDD